MLVLLESRRKTNENIVIALIIVQGDCYFYQLRTIYTCLSNLAICSNTITKKQSLQKTWVFSNSEIDKCVTGFFRVVSRFLSRRFHPKSKQLFPFYFFNIMLRTGLLSFGVTCAVFKIAGEMCQLLAYIVF